MRKQFDEKTVEDLLQAAAAAAKKAHAPYSEFKVGAALLATSEKVYSGCNVENASYGLTMCAERVALGTAVAAGERSFWAIAVVSTGDTPPYPCGACRQVLAEFSDDDLVIIMAVADDLRLREDTTLGQLLPRSFKFRPPPA